ncbi:T9SS type A sorting domain-containing protein [Marinoscillum furvescens]|uniref:Putative secreted protein (Por secretion system target) n=1 Tax=Marinoscillum furvescens DSM 4134 TaxID=1122208 RepID=A0A3D9L595_MARFU|nr:family 16 glycosylhydrolase [Marinoscillum furvescens]REE00120.1 putative secreted protein (Por secretion system target) [Marinoscillum furvescens DSM 4134]
MKKPSYTLLLLLFLATTITFAQPTPPTGKKWEKIENMSDEFNGTSLDLSKWAKSDPQWAGRKPARFETSAISVGGGNLRITGDVLSNPGGGWTHQGGLVRSLAKATYGYYETRMKANKTFLSSTFWLFNKRNEHTGCDVRTTELDVTETIGWNTGGHTWIENNMKRMNSNTHSRGTTCSSTPVGQQGGHAELGEYAYQNYHTYGVWWKSKNELLFYLDGQYKYTITPPADFDLGMYLRMVVESYDWNPPKNGDDGMNGSWSQRTTYYDWTRSWRLVDDTSSGNNTVSCASLPSSVASSTSITVSVPYEASQNRDVVVEFWDTGWLGQGSTTVSAGSGTAQVTIPLNSAPPAGSNYLFKTSIRPVGADWTQNIDACQKNNVTVTTSGPESVSCSSLPTSVASQTSYTVSVPYVAHQSRDVVVEFWDSGWIAEGKTTVSAGSGNASVTINLPAAPAAGNNYLWKSSIRPVGTDWTQNIDACNQNNVTVTGGSCDVPYSTSDLTINNQTINWSSGIIDISCASSVDISMVAAGVGPMENADYLNIYYKLNGGSQVAILENTNTYSSNTLTVNGLSGNTLELIINGYTSYSDETYTVSDISVNNASGARQGLAPDPESLISIYPNPLTSGSVTISIPDQNVSAIRIFNVMGQTVYSAEQVKGQHRIPRSKFAAKGIYLVEIATAQKTMQRKLYIR